MTKEEAVYIVDVWEPIKNFGLNSKNINIWYEAERILRGWDKIQPRGCSCEYKTLARLVHSFREQYDNDVMRLYGEAKT